MSVCALSSLARRFMCEITSGVIGTIVKWFAEMMVWLWMAKKEQVPVPLGICATPIATMVRGIIELELTVRDVVDGTEAEVAVPTCVSRSVVNELIRAEIVGACGRWEHVKALRHEWYQCLED